MQQPRLSYDAPVSTSTPHSHNATEEGHVQNRSAFDCNAKNDTQQFLQTEQDQTHAVNTAADRRKRRKVSVESGSDRLLDDPFHQSATDVITTPDSPQIEAVCPAQDASPATPRKRRGRPPKVPTTSTTTDEIGQMEKGSPKVNGPKTSTPRKDVMQLKQSDTLFNRVQKSPKRSPQNRRSRKTGLEDKEIRPSSTNIVMKKGKLSHSMVIRLRYTDHKTTGDAIDSILAAPSNKERKHRAPIKPLTNTVTGTIGKTTHPFFAGKAKPSSGPAATNETLASTSVQEQNDTEVKKPVAWKDVVFQTKRPATAKNAKISEQAPWPPHELQHIGTETRVAGVPHHGRKQKSNARIESLDDQESAFVHYQKKLQHQTVCDEKLVVPQRLYCTAAAALTYLRDLPQTTNQNALDSKRTKALRGRSAFDRLEPPGPLPWCQKHAPTEWSDVLQPKAGELHAWLKRLAVHNVKQGLNHKSKVLSKRRKKMKKHDDELDDFIVEDDEDDSKKVKNAILLVGPNGCGKTASVYAVAKELGFEVFEIHSGMRRSQKDIFDRVGDMAQNHMVQSGHTASRDSSVVPELSASSSQEDHAQPSVTSFFGDKAKRLLQDLRSNTLQPTREQRQSLILFEEVDQLFDEDRGFWTAVQSLSTHSKRPVIMTCNDLERIPLDELDLFTILHYERPRTDTVMAYLSYVVATEGHIIDAHALHHLYESKGRDLRATIAELEFWCQMTVGSDKGGLDWYPRFTSKSCAKTTDERIFSKGTYRTGLDLIPFDSIDLQSNLEYFEQCLNIPVTDWLEDASSGFLKHESTSQLQALRVAELLSDTDLLGTNVKPTFAAEIYQAQLLTPPDPTAFVLNHIIVRHYQKDDIYHFSSLAHLAIERPIFPPAQGRLAPSLDMPRSVLAADVAPYARSIAAFDHRLEQQRVDVDAAEGKKSRTTRAARAAAEGGDKATTRRERWFPVQVDLNAVLETGGAWPQWYEHDNDDLGTGTPQAWDVMQEAQSPDSQTIYPSTY